VGQKPNCKLRKFEVSNRFVCPPNSLGPLVTLFFVASLFVFRRASRGDFLRPPPLTPLSAPVKVNGDRAHFPFATRTGSFPLAGFFFMKSNGLRLSPLFAVIRHWSEMPSVKFLQLSSHFPFFFYGDVNFYDLELFSGRPIPPSYSPQNL